MLPNVKLTEVTRDDVDRIAYWLRDPDVSSRWFGEYAVGDPVHPAYEPEHMVEASDTEWSNVFHQPYRKIYSIYTTEAQHIGEARILRNENAPAEISLLIGRKELWHQGFGTAAMLLLLEQIFSDTNATTAIVEVPSTNTAALGLFEKLGFSHRQTRQVTPNLQILRMSIKATDWLNPSSTSKQTSLPGITITGSPSTGSYEIASQIAKILNYQLIGETAVTKKLQERLGCSERELDTFIDSQKSVINRFLTKMITPHEYSPTHDFGYPGTTPRYIHNYDHLTPQPITKTLYQDKLGRVIRQLVNGKNSVIHTTTAHLFVPNGSRNLRVLVTGSDRVYVDRVIAERKWTTDDWMQHNQIVKSEIRKIGSHLLDADPLDPSGFDLVINLERIPSNLVPQMVADSLPAHAPARGDVVDRGKPLTV
ncbi:MAG: GNAT family N-acetyltransferase [SAR202 cluster bacterium]|nr:GNAT family N-acetyltransferase [SAR202 cluster bacterium]